MAATLAGLGLLLGVLVGVGTLRPVSARPRYYRRCGLIVMAVFVLFAGLFVAGEAFTDPGGWQAVALTTLWLAPLVGLVLLAWLRPRWGLVALSALTGLLLVGYALGPSVWRGYEDAHGPVRAVAGLVLAAALATLGWRRPGPAGWLLVALGVVPVLVSLTETGGRLAAASWTVVGLPGIAAGILYLLAAHATGSGTPDRAAGPGNHRPENHPGPENGPESHPGPGNYPGPAASRARTRSRS